MMIEKLPSASVSTTFRYVLASLLLLTFAGPAQADFHKFEIREIFSNADGSVQFVELIATKDDQEALGGHLLTSNSSSYTFPGHLPSVNTDGRSVLVATTAFAALPGAPTPDYILPDHFLSSGGDTIDYGDDTHVVQYNSLPTDGLTSINQNGTLSTNSPRNFAGASGSIDASSSGSGVCGDGTVDVGEDCDNGTTASGNCCSASCQFEVMGLSCSDSNACTNGDTCDGAGSCTQGAPVFCDDTNDCTIDSCNPATGCTATNTPAGTSCNDSSLCTQSDSCNGAGSCIGDPIVCNDTNDCTTDSCNPATGCTTNNAPSGTSCNDSNLCTESDFCDGAGSCQATSPLDCDDGDACTADGCDSIDGCFHSEIIGCAPSVPSSGVLPRSLLLMAMLGLGVAGLRATRA